MAGSAGDVAAPGAPPRATGREWAGLAVLALPTLVVAMDLTVLHLAVPHISADLRPSSAQMLWIVDIYGFLVAGSLITMGTLGDRIGRRRLLLAGATAFSAASVLAAFSDSAEMLIATRALLGLAGATLLPSTVALIRNMFVDPKQRVVAIGIWAAVFSAGTALGPVIGGVLLDWFWWGSVFLLGLPLMAGLLAFGRVLLPEFRDPDAGRLDLPSAALSLTGVLGVVYGLKRIAEDGLAVPPVLFIVAGLVIGVVFVLRQRRLPDPLIDLRLFRIPAFSVSLVAGLVALFTWAGTYLFLAQYLQLVEGLSPLEAGVWLLPAAGGSIAGSMLSPALTRRVRPATVLAAGLWVAAVGFAVVSRVEATSSLPALVAGSIVFSIGVASTVALVTDQVVGAAPPERAGGAAALSETGGELGLALGVAILGSIGTAIYRGDLADAPEPGLTAEAQEAARDTLGGAVAVAGQLPESAAAGFLDTAHEAFTHGLQVTAGISGLVVAAAAIVVTLVLRRAGAEAPSDAPPETSSLDDTATAPAPNGVATIHSAATLPCRCCGPELITTVPRATKTDEPHE
jgi:MFS transporter, DHA2 family, multidrug resistance protein